MKKGPGNCRGPKVRRGKFCGRPFFGRRVAILAAKNAPGVAGVGGLMMRKWLAYWQLAAVWIALSFLAALIYLFPIARVVEALVD